MMFWLNEAWVDAQIQINELRGKTVKEVALDIAREQVREFLRWQLEICDIHHSKMVRMDCEECLKNMKKELEL